MKKKCPRCGSKRVAPIQYGMPALTEEMQKKLKNEEIYIGGCIISDMNPKYHCFDCNKDFGTAPILFSKYRENGMEDYRDIVTSITFSRTIYIGGSYVITFRKKNDKYTVKIQESEVYNHSYSRELSQSEWDRLLDTLYCKLYLYEWKKRFKLEPHLIIDGEFWNLDIGLTNKRVRTYRGDNEYPPYWNELLKAFEPFFPKCNPEKE